MFWVRWSDLSTQYDAIFWSGDTTPGANAYDASFMIVNGNPANTIEVWCKNSSLPRLGPTASFATNTWYHVAATYGTANGAAIELFVDGVSVATGTAGSAAAFQTEDTQFGNDANSDNHPAARIMCGKMWNRILTAAEIRAEMWSALPVSADSLWGCWSLFDDSGGLHDLSGNGRHLTESGTLTVEANDCGVAFDTPRTFTGYNRTAAAGGAMTGAVTLDITPTGTLTGAGALTGAVALTVTPTGALTGAGALVGSVALSLTPTGTLTATGALLGSITNALDVTGVLTGAGALAGAVALSVGVSGVFDAPSGAIAGDVQLAFGVGGALTGTGALAGSVPLTITVSGTLADPLTPVVSATPVPAGASSSRYRRSARRLFVQIDGQDFEVASEAQAVELLTRARAIAEQQAEQKAVRVEKRLRKKPAVPVVELKVPSIVVPHELAAATAPLIADIERLYRKASVEMELRLLLARQREADERDDEDVLLLS